MAIGLVEEVVPPSTPLDDLELLDGELDDPDWSDVSSLDDPQELSTDSPPATPCCSGCSHHHHDHPRDYQPFKVELLRSISYSAAVFVILLISKWTGIPGVNISLPVIVGANLGHFYVHDLRMKLGRRHVLNRVREMIVPLTAQADLEIFVNIASSGILYIGVGFLVRCTLKFFFQGPVSAQDLSTTFMMNNLLFGSPKQEEEPAILTFTLIIATYAYARMIVNAISTMSAILAVLLVKDQLSGKIRNVIGCK